MSAECPPVMLLNTPPTLTRSSRLLPTPASPRHCTDVLDCHVDLSHAVHADRTPTLYGPSPSPPPTTVRLSDPVAAPFDRPTALARPLAPENPPVTLPSDQPAVAIIVWLRLAALECLHPTDESLAHVLCSHAVGADLTRPLLPVSPRPPPATETLKDPVDAALLLSTPLIVVASVDSPIDDVPTTDPVVTKIALDPPAPPLPRHTSPVLDVHWLRSHDV